MTGLILRSLALALVVLLASPVAAGAARWQWPLAQHRLESRFDYKRSDRYRGGAHRTLTLRGAPGAPVRAVCSGVVSFAGLLPDGRPGVTIRCGQLAATELGLLRSEVARGDSVLAGQRLGALGAGRLLSVGARRSEDRDGYSDPLALLAEPPRSLPILPLAPRGRQTPPPPAPARRAPSRAGGPGQSASPWLLGAAWLGLGVSGAAIGAGIALRGRRGRRELPPAAVVRAQRQQ